MMNQKMISRSIGLLFVFAMACTLGMPAFAADASTPRTGVTVSSAEVQEQPGTQAQSYDVPIDKFGVQGTFRGVMRQKMAPGVGSSSYGGTAEVDLTNGSAKKVTVAIKHAAFGLIGTNGKNLPLVGIIYDGNVNQTEESGCETMRMDQMEQYHSILPVYTTMTATTTVTTAGGDEFTCESSTGKILWVNMILCIGLILLPIVKLLLKECPHAWASVQLPWNVILSLETLVVGVPSVWLGCSILMDFAFTFGWFVSVLLVLALGLGMIDWCYRSWKNWWHSRPQNSLK